ncbi:MAG TPA: hypothetical protein VMN82_14500 [Thermoanaerobaculia bacterium]|nr:hypothetical protein [Thermoanaerobaculia bacterium]
MPTSKPPKPDPMQELTPRRIAEFALEESRLSNVTYRFQLVPRERVWKNWDRTEFEPNHYRVVGLAGVCLERDEVERAHRIASRALEELDGILFVVEEPADSIIVRGVTGTMEFVRTPTLCAEIMAGTSAAFDRALGALGAAFPGERVAGKIVSEGRE